jgi:ribosomal 50S subunit-recycling heat shock protein
MTPEEKKIFDMQCASTRAALSRPVELDLEWFRRPIPSSAQVLKEDGSVDLNLRAFTASEVKIEESLRLVRGQRIEEMRVEKTPGVTLTEEKKERATAAWMKSRTMDAIKNVFKELMKDVKRVSAWGHRIEE